MSLINLLFNVFSFSISEMILHLVEDRRDLFLFNVLDEKSLIIVEKVAGSVHAAIIEK